MVRRVLWRAALPALLAFAVAAGGAQASDSSTTLAYLRANEALVKVGQSNLGKSIAAYDGVLAQVRHDCPLGAASSPQDTESTQLSNEVIGAMVISAGQPDRPAIARFLRATRGLRWSSAKVTREVSSYDSMLGKLYGLSTPDVCGDVAKWKASNWAALPSSTVGFVKVFYPNWVALGLLPPGIASSESGQSKALARSSAAAEYQITNTEAKAVETWAQIMNELELNP